MSAGYAVVAAESGSTTPAGSAVFRHMKNGTVVTEAGVRSSSATTNARILVDATDGFTGVALVNQGDQALNVVFTMLDQSGFVRERNTQTIAARGHLAVFANELFSTVDAHFVGLMDISSPSPVSAITLKLVINQREDLIYTTLPVADMNAAPSGTTAIIPQIALGGGFSTKLCFINTDKANAISGQLGFYKSDGGSMAVAYGNGILNRFAYKVSHGGGTQFFPGNRPSIASIRILDPGTSLAAQEIIVNEGNTVKARLQVLDETGTSRDDAELSFVSLNPDVATVDPKGNIAGKKAGFSTVTISSGKAITTGTITVVSVQTGVSGYTITGIMQDTARRLYLAATLEDIILQASDLNEAPQVFAGIRGTSGYKDDERLKALFNRPGFLAYDHARGQMYVSDGSNHAIRYIRPGSVDRVATLAGGRKAGSEDGIGPAASFNNPQGVVLDGRGYLWVADSGNHTIRRINLTTGKAETIAGKAGTPGNADGTGEAARFHSPAGIALEAESISQQLDRESRLLPPPSVSVIVADRDNGLLRRVRENGVVETIQFSDTGGSEPEVRQSLYSGTPAAVPAVFNQPMGVAVDPFGNIYVTEPASSRVRTILANGSIVEAIERGTLNSPSGLAATQDGKVLIADAGKSARGLSYGQPQITLISPDRVGIAGGDEITVTGKNFGPESVVAVAGALIGGIEVTDSQTIHLRLPSLRSGLTTLTVQNRGGAAQKPFQVAPAPLNALPAGYITTVAGGTTYIGDGGPGLMAPVAAPEAIAVSTAGDLFISSLQNYRVRKIDIRTKIITTAAGNGERYTSSGYEEGLAISVPLGSVQDIAMDVAGNLYICDEDRIRKVSSGSGMITTVAGGGWLQGDNIRAVEALLINPRAVAVDARGSLFIAQGLGKNCVRRVDAQSGLITTFAGSGTAGYSGDQGPAIQAQLNEPSGLAVDPAGNLFIADKLNNRIRRVDAGTGIITTIAGTGKEGNSGDNGPALLADIYFPYHIAFDSASNLLITVPNRNLVRRVNIVTGIISTVAGGGQQDVAGDVNATNARLNYPSAVATDGSGNIFIAERTNHRILMVHGATGKIAPFAGNGQMFLSGENAPAAYVTLNGPVGIAQDNAGNLFISEFLSHRVGKVDPEGMFSGFAGILSFRCGHGGDSGPATSAQLCYPAGIAFNALGDLHIVESGYGVIRKVKQETGIITTVAGNSSAGYSGDGGPADKASLNSPQVIVFDGDGSCYIADTGNHRIRKIDSKGFITTVAGNGQTGFTGDGGPAVNASLNYPYAVAVDHGHNLLVADTNNHRIRKVDLQTGIITTVVGNGVPGEEGDSGPAIAAQLSGPTFVTVSPEGDLLISCSSQIRRVNSRNGIITTIAGKGSSLQLTDGDNGPAYSSRLNSPSAIVIDAAGNLYLSDSAHNRIRAIRAPIR